MPHQPNYLYTRYTSTAIAQLGTGVGLLHTINITGTSLGNIAVRDMDASSVRGTIAVLNTNVWGCYTYDAQFNTGLRIETPGGSQLNAPDVTITWTLGY